jgi:Kef-type K+ transport system membrane component KefB
MPGFDLLSTTPAGVQPLLLAGLILVAGLLAGECVQRWLRIPRLTGYVAAGVGLGPGGLGLLDRAGLEQAQPLMEIALGLVLFELGSRLDWQWLRRNPWLLATGIAESALAFSLICVALSFFQFAPAHAAIAAAIGMATAPSVLLLVVHDQRADGPLTELAVNLTALNNVFAVVTVTMLLAHLHFEYDAGWYVVVLHPLYLLFGSLALGLLAAEATLAVGQWMGRREHLQFLLLVAMILVSVACASALRLSVLGTLLAFGVLTRNRDLGRWLLPVQFGTSGQFFLVLLFVLTGAHLDPHALSSAGWAVAAYIAARLVGKVVGVGLLAPMAGLRVRKAGLLGVALMPMSAVAVMLAGAVANLYPGGATEVVEIVLAVVLVLDLVGPAATQWALTRAGEVPA